MTHNIVLIKKKAFKILRKLQSSTLLKWSAGSFFFKILSTIISFINYILISRLMGSISLGTYSYVLSLAALMSVPATLGLDKLINREFPKYHARKEWALMKGIWQSSNLIVLVSSTTIAFCSILIYIFLSNYDSPSLIWPFIIAFSSIPISSLRSLRLSAMRGLRQILKGQYPEYLISPVIFGGFIIILNIASILNTETLLISYTLSVLISHLVGIKLFHSVFPSKARKSKSTFKIKNWLHSSLSLMLLGSIQIILSRSDIVMLGMIRGVEEVAIYSVADRVSDIIKFILVACANTITPIIASYYAKQDLIKVQTLIRKCNYGLLVALTPVTILFIIFSKQLLGLFGKDFLSASDILNTLLVVQFLYACTATSSTVLTTCGFERFTLLCASFGCILNISINLILIPLYGAIGAAIATGFSFVTMNLGFMYFLHKKMGLSPF